MTSLFLILLASISCLSSKVLVSVQAELPDQPLGLFLRRRWKKWLTADQSVDCDASSCATRLGEGCFPQFGFNIENVCYRDISRSLEQFLGTERRVLATDDTYCDLECDDGAFVVVDVNNQQQEPACLETNRVDLGDCSSGDPTSIDNFYIPEFCIWSETPRGDFIYPLYEYRIYASEAGCASNSPVHRREYLPGDPSLCVPQGVNIGENKIFGSSTWQCQADGTFARTAYTDRYCSVPVPKDEPYPDQWVIDADSCSPPLTGPGEDVGPQRYTMDCSAPKFHCKDLSQLDYFETTRTSQVNDDSDENILESSDENILESSASFASLGVSVLITFASWFSIIAMRIM